MKNAGRLKKSANNFLAGILNRIVSIILSFTIRTVFIIFLSKDYLSVNGLYSGILTMLSFAELGFGTAITYSMYKPLAEKDIGKLRQLMRLYKRVYYTVGAVILILGLSLIPFMDLIIKDKPDIQGLTFYYIVFLLNTVFSYWFFAYRTAVFNADQRSSVVSHYQSLFNIIKTIRQILSLVLFRNYTLYLFIQIGCTIGQNVCLSIKAGKEYPIFRSEDKDDLPAEERRHIFKDTKALMLRKISFSILYSSDTLIISSMIGVKWVGLLSNYVMIEDTITGILTRLNHAISASLGNYFATENNDNSYKLFQRVEFLNYWLYSFCSIAMITLINPFIQLWIGKDFLMSFSIVTALAIRFFTAGYMNTMGTFRTTMGLFVHGQFVPVITSVANVLLSIVMGKYLGVAGVLFATSLTRLCMDMWYTPMIIYKHGFKQSVSKFFIDYLFRLLLLITVSIGMILISRAILSEQVTIQRFILLAVLTIMLPNAIFIIVLHKRAEFKELVSAGKKLLKMT